MKLDFKMAIGIFLMAHLFSCGDAPSDSRRSYEEPALDFDLGVVKPRVKVMTFNVLGGDLCRNMRPDLRALAQYIKNNSITVAAIQEMISRSEANCPDYHMVEILREELRSLAPNYTVVEKQYLKSSVGEKRHWYRAFVFSSPIVGSMVSTSTEASNAQGADVLVLDTQLGKIRFVNIHPQPGQQALKLDQTLLPFLNTLRTDGIPLVLMGDYNLSYERNDSAAVLAKIEQAGFYRGCNPKYFPDGHCNDSVTSNDVFAVDHVFIDERANFSAEKAFVETSMKFSDHLPVVVELANHRWQQIFAHNKYWTLDIDASYQAINPGGLAGTALTSNNVYKNGPCRGQENSCRFDAFAVGTMRLDSKDVQVQQIVANGKYWTLNIDNGYQAINPHGMDGCPLASNALFANGPCKGQEKCSFDAMAMGSLRQGGTDMRVLQIIAYGRYWTFDVDNGFKAVNPGALQGTPLIENSFYAKGPCLANPGHCQIDSLGIGTLKQGNREVRVQQITAYGKYWTLDVDDGYKTINPNGLAGMPLKDNALYFNGPCHGSTACPLDDIGIHTYIKR